MFYVVPASAFTQLIFFILMILCGERFSFTTRIVGGYLFSSIGIGITPMFVHRLTENIAFWTVLAISSFIGITTAIVQASVVGLMNYSPSSYIQVSFAGQALSGITACIIRIVTKFYHIYGGISDEEGGIVYFGTLRCRLYFVTMTLLLCPTLSHSVHILVFLSWHILNECI